MARERLSAVTYDMQQQQPMNEALHAPLWPSIALLDRFTPSGGNISDSLNADYRHGTARVAGERLFDNINDKS